MVRSLVLVLGALVLFLGIKFVVTREHERSVADREAADNARRERAEKLAEDTWTATAIALGRAKVTGCGDMEVVSGDKYGIVRVKCGDGREHYVNFGSKQLVDGQPYD